MPVSLPLALLMAPTAAQRLVQRMFAETPFADVHRLVWFDWAMLVPYFTVLVILSIYGLHRYEIIRTYFKHRGKAVGASPRLLRRTFRLNEFVRFSQSLMTFVV